MKSKTFSDLTNISFRYGQDEDFLLDSYVFSSDFNNAISVSDSFKNCLDSKINDTNLFIITDTVKLSDVAKLRKLENTNRRSLKTNILNDKYLKLASGMSGFAVDSALLEGNDNFFTIEFIDSLYCYIKHVNIGGGEKYLNTVKSGEVGLYFEDYAGENCVMQYIIDNRSETESKFTFFKKDDTDTYVIKFDTRFKFVKQVVDLENVDNSIVHITSKLKSEDFNFELRYGTYAANDDKILGKATDDVLKSNYLLEASLYNIEDNKLNLNFFNLKNEFNAAGLQGADSLIPNLTQNQFRYYRKIFSGNNQETGSDYLNLSYEHFSTAVKLKSGKMTYFNLPQHMGIYSRLNINSLNFQEQGAISGNHPLRADKIFKKKAGYKNTTPNGNPSDEKNGVYLCTWLRYAGLDRPVWYDRYYFPTAISDESALRDYGKIYNELNASTRPNTYVYDVPSNLTLEEGCHYAYHHVGKADMERSIQDLRKFELGLVDGNKYRLTKKHGDYLSLHCTVRRNDDSRTYANQLFGNLTNDGVAIYNTHIITPLIYSFKNNGNTKTIQCSNCDAQLVHETIIPFVPKDIIVRDYREDILVIGSSTANAINFSDKTKFPHTELTPFQTQYSAYIMTYDLKIKAEIAIPSCVFYVEGSMAYFRQDENVVSFDIDTIEQEQRLRFISYRSSILFNNQIPQQDTKFFVHNSTAYAHNYTKVVRYTDSKFLALEGSVILEIDVEKAFLGQNEMLKAIVTSSERIHDFDIDGRAIVAIHSQSGKRFLSRFEAGATVFNSELNANPSANKFFISKEFDYDKYNTRYFTYTDTSAEPSSLTYNTLVKYDQYGQRMLTGNSSESPLINTRADNGFAHIARSTADINKDALFLIKIRFKNKLLNKRFTKDIYIVSKSTKREHSIGITINAVDGNGKVYFEGEPYTDFMFEPGVFDIRDIPESYAMNRSVFFNNVSIEEYTRRTGDCVSVDTEVTDVIVTDTLLTDGEYSLFVKKNLGINDMTINVPVSKVNVIETIERFFKFRGTGYKSNAFNIVISGADMLTIDQKNEIEESISNSINSIKPVNTDLHQIIWQ